MEKLKPVSLDYTEEQKAVLNIFSGKNASHAIATLNYCISVIQNSATFNLHNQVSSTNPSTDKV